jgi:hypothetical protein
MYGAIPAPEERVPRVVLARGASMRAIASAVLSVVAVAALVLLASHSHSNSTELVTQKLNYLIPFNKVRSAAVLFLAGKIYASSRNTFFLHTVSTPPQPYPDNIDDDRAWGDDDYNPKHGYNNADGGDLEVISVGKNALDALAH